MSSLRTVCLLSFLMLLILVVMPVVRALLLLSAVLFQYTGLSKCASDTKTTHERTIIEV
jgi:hypothetical protein